MANEAPFLRPLLYIAVRIKFVQNTSGEHVPHKKIRLVLDSSIDSGLAHRLCCFQDTGFLNSFTVASRRWSGHL